MHNETEEKQNAKRREIMPDKKKKTPESKTLTVRLPYKLWRKLKVKAIDGVSVNAQIVEAIKKEEDK